MAIFRPVGPRGSNVPLALGAANGAFVPLFDTFGNGVVRWPDHTAWSR